MSEAIKELVRRHFEDIWSRRDLATADELLAQFPDLHKRVEAIVAEGDTVAARVFSEGTNQDLVAMLQLGVVQPPGRPPA